MRIPNSNLSAFLRDGIAGIVDGVRRARLYPVDDLPGVAPRDMSPWRRTEVDLTADQEAQRARHQSDS